ncbi:DUF4139 domain-containing protein [Streptomyces sp. NPDC059247]|uniref:DUF4139 domain-containing protein n=1 Tax=Streptomyces sp. NPDC059247 TaxID=3346790 RepID=UPI00367A362C
MTTGTERTTDTTGRWASSLDSVVVYARGALCRRLARGVVPPDGRVRVTGLPRTLDHGSLRARVLGSPGPRVTEARVEIGAEPRATVPDGRDALRREVERLRDGAEAARARRDRQRALVAEIGALRPVAPPRRRDEPQHRRTPVDAWLELADFVDGRLTGLHARLTALDEELLRAEHALELAADQLDRASTDAPSRHVDTTVHALLTVAGAGAEPVEIEVEYGVPGAVWVPAYRLSHRQGEDTGRLVLRASVAQRTGEDWTGVRVALATADLSRRTDPPKLRSIRIGRRQEAPAASGWREPPTGLDDLFTGYDAAGPRPGAGTFAGAFGPAGSAVPVAVGGPPAPLSPPPTGLPVPGGPGSAPEAFDGQGYGGQGYGGQGYGADAFAAERHAPAPARTRSRSAAPGGAAFGAAPAAFAAPPPAPSAPGAPAPGAAPPVPPPVPGPPRPDAAALDYPALVLRGPDEPGHHRGRLFPGTPSDAVAAEYRRRAEAVAALPLPAHAVLPRESAGSFDQRFDAAARADVPSDGTWHTVTVMELAVGLRTEHLAVPSVEPVVYATLVLSNASDRALLAGPVEVTVDGEFLRTSALPTLAPGGTSRLGLGPAEGVRVSRNAHLRESTSGLRNQTAVLDHRVRVELSNGLARPVTVEVRERVPVSSDPDVRIEEHTDWSAPGDDGPERHAPGTRLWRVELPAGGTTALDGRYEIRIPAGKALVGGNRRS